MTKKEEIIKLHKQGLSDKEIIEKADVSRGYVYKVLHGVKEEEEKEEVKKEKVEKVEKEKPEEWTATCPVCGSQYTLPHSKASIICTCGTLIKR